MIDTAHPRQTTYPASAGLRLPRPSSWTLPVAMAIAVLALMPLGFVLWAGFATGWQAASQLIFRPRVGELMVNTVLLVLFTVPLSTALALALAWLTERTDMPAARFCAWLCITPLAIPAFVHSYAWIGMWPRLNGLGAGVAISIIAYFPFLYLPLSQPSGCSIRLWRIRRPPSACLLRRSSFGSCCRNCVWRYAAARCWSGCISLRNMVFSP